MGKAVVRNVHVICLGQEDVGSHQAGLLWFGGDQIILFHPPDLDERLQHTMKTLQEFGPSVYPQEVEYQYDRAFAVIAGVVNAEIDIGTCLAINASCGEPAVIHAATDAAMSVLVRLHPNAPANKADSASAYRYFIRQKGRRREALIAPLFNFLNPKHRDIVTAMMVSREPMTSRQLFDFIGMTIGSEHQDTYADFRRNLNGVRRWLDLVPTYREEVERGIRYSLTCRLSSQSKLGQPQLAG